MPGNTIASGFSAVQNANTLKGGQWQASTSGFAVPSLPAGTVPASGGFALGIHQVAQKPALQPNPVPGALHPVISPPATSSAMVGAAGGFVADAPGRLMTFVTGLKARLAK